ncbi:MAG: hypothetical protein NT157_06365, partial [Candidatus Micrarchaeota archaeon]|nr:hypothetical protein [Candidatus Micrarchaeota archaeon]
MEEYHGRKLRKSSGSGGRVKPSSDSKRRAYGGHFTATKVGENDLREIRRARGGKRLVTLKKAAFV